MPKVILLVMMTLDGFFDAPGESLEKIDWHHADQEWEDYSVETLSGSDTLLFGRKTYAGFVHIRHRRATLCTYAGCGIRNTHAAWRSLAVFLLRIAHIFSHTPQESDVLPRRLLWQCRRMIDRCVSTDRVVACRM